MSVSVACLFSSTGSKDFAFEKAFHNMGDHCLAKTFWYAYEWAGEDSTDMNMIKSGVMGESMVVNGKNKKELPSKGMATLLFACNDLPELKNDNGELSRRVLFLPFMNRIRSEDIDTDLQAKISKQRAMLAYVCTQSALEYNTMCEVRNCDPLRSTDEEILPVYYRNTVKVLEKNNPVYMFLEDLTVYEHDRYYKNLDDATMENPRLVRGPEKYMSMDDFMTVLKTWGMKNPTLSARAKDNIKKLDQNSKAVLYALEELDITLSECITMPWFIATGTGVDDQEFRRPKIWLASIGFKTHGEASEGAFKFDAFYRNVGGLKHLVSDDDDKSADDDEDDVTEFLDKLSLDPSKAFDITVDGETSKLTWDDFRTYIVGRYRKRKRTEESDSEEEDTTALSPDY